MVVSDYIAAGSLLVAFVALVKSFLSDRKVKNLDLQLKERELRQRLADEEDAKKADIEVEVIESFSRARLDVLRFYNKGQATAYNISFKIRSEEEENPIILNIQDGFLPYPKLLSLQKFDVSFMKYSSKPHQTILITWDDECSKGRSKEMVVDM